MSRRFGSGYGFTLVELVVLIAVLSIAGVVIVLPLVSSAPGFGAVRPSLSAKAAGLARGQAALAAAELAGVGGDEWKNTLSALQASSPIIMPAKALDDDVFEMERFYTCVTENITADPDCAAGLVLVTVTVRTEGLEPSRLVFLSSKNGGASDAG
ncbi:MAG: type II secretion system protein [Candidatus Nitrospinota bacterium M3_3B_026]